MIPDNVVPVQPELPCPTCGAIDTPAVSPGTGPHAYRADCRHCGGFVRWLSQYTPEERQARRDQARDAAMAEKPPSQPQLALLASLGCSAVVSSMLSASVLIAGVLSKRSEVAP